MADLFEEKSKDYDERPIPLQISAAVGEALGDAVAWRKEMRVIDFGAGTGLVASHVAPRVAHIAAVDISRAMLERLADKPELADKVAIHCQNILEEPLAERGFDGVVSAMAMHHVEDTDAMLAAFRRHLEPGGFVALADLDAEPGTFHPPDNALGVFHHGFDRDALTAKLEAAGFTDVAFRTVLEVVRDERPYPIFLVTAAAR